MINPYKKIDIDPLDDIETKLIKRLANCASFCFSNPDKFSDRFKFAWVFMIYELYGLDIITDEKFVESFVKCVYPEYYEYLLRSDDEII